MQRRRFGVREGGVVFEGSSGPSLEESGDRSFCRGVF